jgi:glycosyltransferase involved in cell wall biosynthesis
VDAAVHPLRILVAHAFYRIPGGEDRYVEQQVDLLRDRHTVELFAGRNSELPGSAAAARRMFSPTAMRSKIEAAIRSLSPDVVHVHNVYPALGASVHTAARRSNVPLVMTVHNYRLRCPNGYRFTEGRVCDRCIRGNHVPALIHDCFPSKTQALGYATALWLDRFVRRIDQTVDLFIAPSDFMADRLRSWGISADRIQMVRNFTNGWTGGPVEVGSHGVYVGRLSSEKGVDVLLQALHRCGDPPFVLLGDGPLHGPLEEMARDLGLRNVTFEGRVDRVQLDQILGTARYLVMPSLSDENSPLAVFEALARGVPAIVTDRGGLPELVDRSLVVTSGDHEDLARAIELVRLDDEVRARAADAARDFTRRELRPETHRERLEEAYGTAISRHQGGP